MPVWPIFSALLGTLLALAIAWDLTSRRIPNAVALAVAGVGAALALATDGAGGLASGLGAGALVGALLWRPWTAGALGGGDLKLAVAAALPVGLNCLPTYLLIAALAGGAVALACYAGCSRGARRAVRASLFLSLLGRRMPLPPGSAAGRISVPYAPAIALGALAALALGGRP